MEHGFDRESLYYIGKKIEHSSDTTLRNLHKLIGLELRTRLEKQDE